MEKCQHLAEDGWIRYILKCTDVYIGTTISRQYFPLTGYGCFKCGEEFFGDGIWWALQGIPGNVIFEPEPEGDEIMIDLGFGKIKLVKRSEGEKRW